MQEYIVYAILIFVPVGVIMEYLLRREGLALNYRMIIISSSLAIIISFPLLIGNMGIPLALIIYLVAIFVLSWYFIRAAQGSAWYIRQGNTNASDEVYVSKRMIESTRIVTLGDIEDEMWSQKNNAVLSADEATESAATVESLLKVSAGPEDMNYLQDSEQIEQDKISLVNLQIDSPESITAIIPDISANEAEMAAKLDSKTYYKDDDLIVEDQGLIKSLSHEDMSEQLLIANEVKEAEPTRKIEDITPIEDIAPIEDITPIEDMAPEEDIAPIEDITSEEDMSLGDIALTLHEPIEAADPVDVLPAEKQAGEGGLNTLNSEKLIDELIENAFALKQEQRPIEAVQFFKEALEMTTDEELKYLLIMETVNLYKDMGMYAQAEQVLFISIGKAYMRTDIINKIDRQLSYIRLLSVELDRLGLANTPISEVPRMVKMSVAEIMEV